MNLRSRFSSKAKGLRGTRYAATPSGKINTTFGGGRLSDAAIAYQQMLATPAQPIAAANYTF
jgi:hypothetical protein